VAVLQELLKKPEGFVPAKIRLAAVDFAADRRAQAYQALDEVFHVVECDTREVSPHPMSVTVTSDHVVGLPAHGILVARNGQETVIEDSVAPIRDLNGRVTGAVIVFRDVGAALATSRHLSYLAQHDVLTGLPNRLLLTDRLGEAIARAHRRQSRVAVLFLDLDGFKAVNDSQGHAVADGVLQSIANRLTGALRRSDTVCRYGGDEFVILLSEVEHAEDAARVAKTLRDVIAEPHHAGGHDVCVSASIGISLYPDDGRDADTLIAHADALMYEAKRAGLGASRSSPARGVPLHPTAEIRRGHGTLVRNVERFGAAARYHQQRATPAGEIRHRTTRARQRIHDDIGGIADRVRHWLRGERAPLEVDRLPQSDPEDHLRFHGYPRADAQRERCTEGEARKAVRIAGRLEKQTAAGKREPFDARRRVVGQRGAGNQ